VTPESDQHQNLTTYKKSPLAHAYTKFGRNPFVSYLADRRTHTHTITHTP